MAEKEPCEYSATNVVKVAKSLRQREAPLSTERLRWAASLAESISRMEDEEFLGPSLRRETLSRAHASDKDTAEVYKALGDVPIGFGALLSVSVLRHANCVKS